MNKTGAIKSVLIVVILLLVGVLGVLGVNTVKTYIGGASADTMPKNVLARPSDDGKSATVSWVSDKNTIGIVEYGTSPAALLLRAPESDSTSSHSVVLSPLKPNINYYFRIRVGEEVYDNNGIPYSFKTKSSDGLPVPTTAAGVTIMPTAAPTIVVTECKKTVDFNQDGVINTMDYIDCMRKKPVATPTVGSGKCDGKTDFNKDGVVNTLDRIKCLQSR